MGDPPLVCSTDELRTKGKHAEAMKRCGNEKIVRLIALVKSQSWVVSGEALISNSTTED